MCTHLLLEAEGLADQIVVLEDGADLVSRHAARADPPLLARTPSSASTPRTASQLDIVAAHARRDAPSTATAIRREVQLDDLARVPDLVAGARPPPACASRGSTRTTRRSRTCTSPSAAARAARVTAARRLHRQGRPVELAACPTVAHRPEAARSSPGLLAADGRSLGGIFFFVVPRRSCCRHHPRRRTSQRRAAGRRRRSGAARHERAGRRSRRDTGRPQGVVRAGGVPASRRSPSSCR